MTVPRPEHPSPQRRRERWTVLNGVWRFAFDDEDRGLRDAWFTCTAEDLEGGTPFDREITVPFCFQAERSGIGLREQHDVVWYARALPDVRDTAEERLLLHFGAVDHQATVWVNGVQVAAHEGGHTPFAADITDALDPAGNVVVVRVVDRLHDLEQPRGKQYWGTRSESIFYTPTTGIWQTVWLEPVADARIADVLLQPDLPGAAVDITVTVTPTAVGGTLRVRVLHDDALFADDRLLITDRVVHHRVSVLPSAGRVGGDVADWQGVATWSPEQPRLHDVTVDVLAPDGTVVDRLHTYVGMRSIEVRDGALLLNGRPYYQRLVLDQGYFPGGLLTAPTDDDLRRDIELAKELGFDGARKHQKVEDPRWLYWADRLGFLVWGEMANAYQFGDEAVRRLTAEWQDVVRRDRNHPCIVAWVPMNESWGVPRLATDARHREHVVSLYHLTRALDATRPVVSNDGWEHARTDLLTIHDYDVADTVSARYTERETAVRAEPSGRPLYTVGHAHRGEPILLTEFGGIAVDEGAETWGYSTVADGTALLERYRELIAAVAASPVLCGFCYTQLTDVEQEANGLLTFDRKPKADPAALRAATRQPTHERGSTT